MDAIALNALFTQAGLAVTYVDGKGLVWKGRATAAQIEQAEIIITNFAPTGGPPPRLLADILVEKGVLTEAEVATIKEFKR